MVDSKMMKICENCGHEHEGKYGSGRFCTKKCARSFATKVNRASINEKVSNTLKGVPQPWTHERKMLNPLRNRFRVPEIMAKAHATRKKNLDDLRDKLPFEKLSSKVQRVIVLREQQSRCLHCGINSWMDKPLSLQLDHIDGEKTNNKRTNLRMLCPNCHSQTDTYCGRNKRLKNLVRATGIEPV